METGYSFRVDHVEYVATKDGAPLSLVDCIRATQHVGCSNVLRHGQSILRRGINETRVLKRGVWVVTR